MAEKKDDTEPQRSLAKPVDSLPAVHQRRSRERIYQSMMRGGGEPFGAPFDFGPPTLTVRIVNFFKQRGFFNFESLEKAPTKPRANKFTRYGSAPFVGQHKGERKRK